jgi:hypothetical protein
MQRLGVCEEQAYKQLRMQSRRQRKQIREIAQSILDTQFLLEANGFLPYGSPAPDDPPGTKETKPS